MERAETMLDRSELPAEEKALRVRSENFPEYLNPKAMRGWA